MSNLESLNYALAGLPCKMSSLPAKTLWCAIVLNDVSMMPNPSYPKDIEEFGYLYQFCTEANITRSDVIKASVAYPPLRAFLPYWEQYMNLYGCHKYDDVWRRLDRNTCPLAEKIEQDWKSRTP